MTTRAHLVLLFEDDKTKSTDLRNRISNALSPGAECRSFDWEVDGSRKGTYEDQLKTLLSAPTYAGLSLVVTDRDISKSERFPGLSEAVISKVGARLGVPVCVYAAGRGDSVMERQRSGGDGRIILDSKDLDAMARKVAVLLDGFRDCRESLSKALSRKGKRRHTGPAAVLAEVLGKPEIVGHMSLYASGDQRMIAETMPGDKKVRDASPSILPTSLGLWLYDSVLRFPGLVLGPVAAASFLGIEPERLLTPPIRSIFKAALYQGPFNDPDEPRWWRHMLVDLIEKGHCETGRDLAEKITKAKVPSCVCSFNRKSPAGFLCVVTGTPVCDKHSVGQISWLPRGADLSRVRQDVFDEIGPWIGLS